MQSISLSVRVYMNRLRQGRLFYKQAESCASIILCIHTKIYTFQILSQLYHKQVELELYTMNTDEDKNVITSSKKLTDLHINAAQQLLQQKFEDINRLQSTLLQQKKTPLRETNNMIQIIHVRNNHWAVISWAG